MSPRAARFLCLTAATLCGCHCSPPTSPLVADFEGRSGLGKWPRDAPGIVDRSTDWKADGASSLRIDPGLLASISRLYRDDFRGFDALRVQVHNTSSQLTSVGFELSDDNDSLYDRHRTSFGAPPGDSTIDIDLSGDLFRGEENRPFRGPTKTPIDLSSITRIAFENRGDAPLYVDALMLIRDPLPVPPGAFAFDFGKRGSRVMGKTTGIFEDTVFDPTRGHGFLSGKPTFLSHGTSYPSPLLGDGLAWGDAVFQVTLPPGPTLAWIAFERGGFWEEESTGYSSATLLVNGKQALTDTFSPAGPHFFFQDLELTRVADIEPRLVFPAHAVHHFAFDAAAGANTFSLTVKDQRGPPLRVAGLFLAPDTPEGRAYIDALEDRQRRSIKLAFPEGDRARRPADPKPMESPLIVEPRPTGEIAHPRDLPFSSPPAFLTFDSALPETSASLTAVAGHHTFAQLALYAPRDIDVTLAPSQGAPPTPEALPAPRISYGVYGPKRPYEGGATWIETQYFRPLPETGTLHVGPELARSVLLDFDIPAGTPTGRRTAVLRISSNGAPLTDVRLTIDIFAVDLPPLPVPVGLFMSALPFAPDLVGEDRWWTWQETLLSLQGEAGLNTPTGGPGLGFSMIPVADGYLFSGDRALRYLALAKKHGMDRAVVCYSGFLPSIKHQRPDAARFQKSWTEFETANHLPPHYVYAYDEPGTDEELAAATAYLAPFREAGVRTIGFLAGASEPRFRPLTDNTFAMAVSGHTKSDLQSWIAAGKHVFLYNRGTTRLSMGPDLTSMLTLGVAGRLEWIGLYTQGFAFDDLDAREPSYGMFVVHETLGILPTPRWLSLREGLLDTRIHLALEKASLGTTPPLPWPPDYPANPAQWPDPTLETTRLESLKRLTATR